jgi:hypothetical protein
VLVCMSMYTKKDGVHHAIPQIIWCTPYRTPKGAKLVVCTATSPQLIGVR